MFGSRKKRLSIGVLLIYVVLALAGPVHAQREIVLEDGARVRVDEAKVGESVEFLRGSLLERFVSVAVPEVGILSDLNLPRADSMQFSYGNPFYSRGRVGFAGFAAGPPILVVRLSVSEPKGKPSRFVRDHSDFRFVIADASDGVEFESTSTRVAATAGNQHEMFIQFDRFPRTSRRLALSIEDKLYSGGKWRRLGQVTVRLSSKEPPEDWSSRLSHTATVGDEIEIRLGEVSMDTSVSEERYGSPCRVHIPYQISQSGIVTTNWALVHVNISDETRNVSSNGSIFDGGPLKPSGIDEDGWSIVESPFGGDPDRIWKLDATFVEYPSDANQENVYSLTLPDDWPEFGQARRFRSSMHTYAMGDAEVRVTLGEGQLGGRLMEASMDQALIFLGLESPTGEGVRLKQRGSSGAYSAGQGFQVIIDERLVMQSLRICRPMVLKVALARRVEAQFYTRPKRLKSGQSPSR